MQRGGPDGTHYVTDAAMLIRCERASVWRRIDLQRFAQHWKFQVARFRLLRESTRSTTCLAGGMERAATGNVPARVIGVDETRTYQRQQ
jgi:hypothetical protein